MSQIKCKQLVENWQGLLSDLVAQAEAKTQTVKRRRKLGVEVLVQTLVVECLANAKASLSDFVQTAMQLGVRVNTSSFDERISWGLVDLLREVWQLGLHRTYGLERLPIKRLAQFKALYIVDSTQITVAASLAAVFRGNRSNAKMKVHLGLDYLTGAIRALECVAGRRPDQKNGVMADLIETGVLLLFDLGYFQQELLQRIHQASAFFVTRCQSQVALYDPQTQARVHLDQVLKSLKGVTTFEASYLVGHRVKTPLRVVARRLDPQQAAKRRRQAKAKAKSQGKTCSEAYRSLLGWEILVTNLDAAWCVEDLFILYGIRWQIEIVFKVWKSQLGMAALGEWRPQRVLCQFYAHLIGALLCHTTAALVPQVTSLSRAVQVIQHHIADLVTVIRRRWSGIQRWARDLRLALQRFAQQDKRRKSPTTLQFLMTWR